MLKTFWHHLRVSFGVILALVLVCNTTGCAFIGEAVTKEDLLIRYATNDKSTNVKTTLAATVNLSVSGFRTSIPVTAELDLLGDSLHGTMTADFSSINQDMKNVVYELYIVQNDNNVASTYVGRKEDAKQTWYRYDVKLSSHVDILSLVELLRSSSFMRLSYANDPTIVYELVVPTVSFVDAFLQDTTFDTPYGDMKSDQIKDVLGKSKLHITFDKECLPHSASIDMIFTLRHIQDIPFSMSFEVDFQAMCKDYGTLQPADVALPDSVKDSAKLVNDPFDLKDLVNDLTQKVAK